MMKVTPWPMKTSSSIVTPSQMNVWLEILQRAPTTAPRWNGVADHQAVLDDLRSGEMSCLGCHTEIHPTVLSHRAQAAAPPHEKKP